MRDGNVISNVCSKCGAWKGQLGLEPTYQLYLQHLMQVMTECKRILRNDGTIWINLGDSYSTQGGTNTGIAKKDYESIYLTNIMSGVKLIKPKDLPNKSLIGIPQRFVLKCVDELKLIWRNDIPWIKENGMPESVIDRFSKKHEYFYFLTKTTKYYFDLNSIRDTIKLQSIKRAKGIYNGSYSNSERTAISPKLEYGNPERFCNPLGKNPGDVPLFWDGQKKLSLEEYIELAVEYYYSQGDYFNIMTKSNSEKHYATYNEELIYKPIIAGCPENGIVLDPFNGIGTTCVVAKKHNRNYIGIEISDEYCKIAEERLSKLNIDENYLKIKNKQKINNFI
jgi:DNA modification methylase